MTFSGINHRHIRLKATWSSLVCVNINRSGCVKAANNNSFITYCITTHFPVQKSYFFPPGRPKVV